MSKTTTPGEVASSDQLGAAPKRDIAGEALLHAGKCRTWAAKTFNDPPDAALSVGAGDRLLYAAQLLDVQAHEIERLRDELKTRHEHQHEAEALAGHYLVQRDDARAQAAAYENRIHDLLGQLAQKELELQRERERVDAQPPLEPGALYDLSKQSGWNRRA